MSQKHLSKEIPGSRPLRPEDMNFMRGARLLLDIVGHNMKTLRSTGLTKVTDMPKEVQDGSLDELQGSVGRRRHRRSSGRHLIRVIQKRTRRGRRELMPKIPKGA